MYDIIPANVIESSLPFATQLSHYDGAVFTTQAFRGDFIDLISPCYLYSRGSIRYKKLLPTQLANSAYTLSYVVPFTGFPLAAFSRDASDLSATALNMSALSGGKFALQNMSQINGVIEISVPQYLTTHSRLVSNELQNDAALYNYTESSDLSSSLILNTVSSPFNGNYPVGAVQIGYNNYRAMGEDFSLGGFISTVPTTYDTSSGTL
jgi:hypothetical protein